MVYAKSKTIFRVVERDVGSICLVASFGGCILKKYSLLFSFVFVGIQNSKSVNTLTIDGDRNIIANYYAMEYRLKFFLHKFYGLAGPT